MINEAIRDQNKLNQFTTLLARLCVRDNFATVRTSSGSYMQVQNLYDDENKTRLIGFVTIDCKHAWNMNGTSYTTSDIDIEECEEINTLIRYTIDMDTIDMYNGIKIGAITSSQFDDWIYNIKEDSFDSGLYSEQD
jgi:hypothetical protein